MTTKGINLVWIVAKDFEKSIAFYRDVVGLTVTSIHEEFGWAELSGKEGSTLGIVRENPHNAKAGINAVVTLTVDNIEESRESFLKQGAKLSGDIQILPGHVKLQDLRDPDGNMLQLAEVLTPEL